MIKTHWPGISWAFVILLLSTITPPSIKIPDFWDLFGPDKVVHFFMYGVLTFLLVRDDFMDGKSSMRPILVKAFLISAVYGALIEVYQGCLLTNRTGDWTDAVANAIGAAIGVVFARHWLKGKSNVR